MLATVTSQSINKLRIVPDWLRILGYSFNFNNLECVNISFPDDKFNELQKLVTFPSIDDKLYDCVEMKLKELNERIKIVSCSENNQEILIQFSIPKNA